MADENRNEAMQPAAGPRFCIHCKWYDGCGYCTRWRWIDMVTGAEEQAPMLARIERDRETPMRGYTTLDPCGPTGKHFTPAPMKPPPAAIASWWSRFKSFLS